MYDYEKYPICDTDIWVNLCLGEIEDNLFKKYGKVFFASVVRDEILKWSSGPYKCIAEKFIKKVNESTAIIIEIDELDPLDRDIIEKQLIEDAGYEQGFKTPKSNRKDMGEYVSAIVADYYGILLMKSDDHLFKDSGRGKELYPDLEVRSWNNTVVDLITDIRKRKIIFDKVKKSNYEMNQEKDRYNNGQATLIEILKLKQYFS